MKRHVLRIALVVTVALLATPPVADAQEGGKVYRIGWLGSGPAPARSGPYPSFEAFRHALRDHGFVDGRNFVIEARYADGRPERLRSMADELVQLRMDVIVAGSTSAAAELKKATSTIPIVMGSAANPVAAGLVASLGRPGGNVTGLTLETADLTAKRLELLKQAVPALRRLAAFYPGELRTFPVVVEWLRGVEDASRALKVTLKLVDLGHDPSRWPAVFLETAREGISAAMVIEGPAYYSRRADLAELALKHRIAMMLPFREQAEAGGLMAYGADVVELHRRSAGYVAKILRGARPEELPIEQPTKFDLVINLKTARALGLAIPASLLLRADQVIE